MTRRGAAADDSPAGRGLIISGLLPHLLDCAERIKFVHGTTKEKTKDDIARQLMERLEAEIARAPDDDLKRCQTGELAQAGEGTGPVYDRAQEYADGHDGYINEFHKLVANADKLSIKHLRKARKRAGVTQALMARALNVSRATVSNFEHGKGSLSIGQAIGYAAMCGMTIEDAVGTARDDEARLLELYRGASGVARVAMMAAADGISRGMGGWWRRVSVPSLYIEKNEWVPVDDDCGEDVDG